MKQLEFSENLRQGEAPEQVFNLDLENGVLVSWLFGMESE